MNEIGFQRSHEVSLTADEFEQRYQRLAEHQLTAHAEGLVQMDAEERVLQSLRVQIDTLLARHNSGHVLLIENEQGHDYPKLREKITNIVLEGENKLHFHRTVDPPLRVGIYAPRHH